MPQGLNGVAVGAAAIGGLFVYGGLTGKSPLGALKSLIQGQPPSAAAQTQPIAQPSGVDAFSAGVPFLSYAFGALNGTNPPNQVGGSNTPTGSGGGPATGTQPAAGDAIANYAKSFIGAGYEFGGHPADGPGHWDCSSFVNWIVGHLMQLPIPFVAAGHYTGQTHGPISVEWFGWTGATTISHNGDDAQPGDICCWQTHMGIAIGGGQMVSARSATSHPPTGINTINGDIPGEILAVRRLKVG